jgi:hypothetical protein
MADRLMGIFNRVSFYLWPSGEPTNRAQDVPGLLAVALEPWEVAKQSLQVARHDRIADELQGLIDTLRREIYSLHKTAKRPGVFGLYAFEGVKALATRLSSLADDFDYPGRPAQGVEARGGERATEPPEQVSPESRAIGILRDHPDMKKREIAKLVGCHATDLSNPARMPAFVAAAKAIRAKPGRRSGQKNPGRGAHFDAVDD